MVKTPKTRHSKTHREPVTIELQPGDVSGIGEEQAAAPEATENEASGQEGMRAQAADFEPWEKDEAARIAAAEQADRASASADYGFDDTPAQAKLAADTDTAAKADFVAGEPVQPRRGSMSAIVAGVVGGIIALVGAGGLQYAGLLGAPGAGASLEGVNSDIAALKTQIAAISNSENGGDAMARVKGLSDALDQVKTDVAALKASAGSQTGDTAGVTELRDKIAALETTVAALGQAGTMASSDLKPLSDKITELDALVKSAGNAASEQQGRIGALEQSVTQLSAKVEAQASQPKIALAIAASALKAALDRGAPFAAELETFAAIAPDAPQLAALRAYAEKGVATRAEIAAGVDAAATTMVSAATPPDPNGGFFQSLMSSAESLVKVRPIGAVAGAGVPETVARMEAAVNQGDYAKALAEYDPLPDAVKAAGADFAAKIKARLDVEAQIDALIANAMKA
ncbi:COG4223 family protein [Mesorhizobium sp. A623]